MGDSKDRAREKRRHMIDMEDHAYRKHWQELLDMFGAARERYATMEEIQRFRYLITGHLFHGLMSNNNYQAWHLKNHALMMLVPGDK